MGSPLRWIFTADEHYEFEKLVYWCVVDTLVCFPESEEDLNYLEKYLNSLTVELEKGETMNYFQLPVQTETIMRLPQWL